MRQYKQTGLGQIDGADANNLRGRQKIHTKWRTLFSDAQELLEEGLTALNTRGSSHNDISDRFHGKTEKNDNGVLDKGFLGTQNEEKYSEEEDFYPSSEKTSENGEIEKMEQTQEVLPKHFIKNDENFTEETFLKNKTSEIDCKQNEENIVNLDEFSQNNEENHIKDEDYGLFHGDFFMSY